MTETSVPTLVHVAYSPRQVAYSPIALMNYQWTINLHEGYPPLQALLPEECIPPLFITSVTSSQPCFTLVKITFALKILLPPRDNGERLLAKVTIKVVEAIEKADGERFQNLSYILGTDNGKVEEIISYSQLVEHQEAAANEKNKINITYTSSKHLMAVRDPSRQQTPI